MSRIRPDNEIEVNIINILPHVVFANVGLQVENGYKSS